MTRETVLKDTPASRATSLMVAIFKSVFHLDARIRLAWLWFAEVPHPSAPKWSSAPCFVAAAPRHSLNWFALKSCVGQCPPPVIAIALTGTSPHPSRLIGSVAGLH